MNAKKVIKGIAKNTGKYTLKGLGKGVELTGRGAIKTVDALVKNPEMQKIATGAGILAASVMIPTVGVGLASTLGLKYVIDKSLLGKDKGMLDEINDILRVGSAVTRNASNKILSPILKNMDRGMDKLGKNYQDKVDDIFR
jgi:hypothetical protein